MVKRLPSTAEIGVLHSRAYRKLQKFLSSYLEPAGLSMMEWCLVGTVATHKNLSMTDIAEQMGYDLSHITNLVNTLDDRGLVKRVTSKKDRRQKSVALTSKGQQVHNELETAMSKEMNNWLNDFDQELLANYLETLGKISELDC